MKRNLILSLLLTILIAPLFAAEPSESDAGSFVFRKSVREVVVHIGVVDSHSKKVPFVGKDDVTVTDNGKAVLAYTSFEREEHLPLRIGILIDGSVSTKDAWKHESKSAAEWLRAIMRSGDEGFVAVFNGSVQMTQDWTGDTAALEAGMFRFSGDTARTRFYDALAWANAKFDEKRSSQPTRNVLLVVTDGEDTSSKVKFEQTETMLLASDVVVYGVGMGYPPCNLYPEWNCKLMTPPEGKGILVKLSEATGGKAYFPKCEREVREMGQRISDEMRTFYRVSFRPEDVKDGSYRTLGATVDGHGHKLLVHVRSGYIVTEGR